MDAARVCGAVLAWRRYKTTSFRIRSPRPARMLMRDPLLPKGARRLDLIRCSTTQVHLLRVYMVQICWPQHGPQSHFPPHPQVPQFRGSFLRASLVFSLKTATARPALRSYCVEECPWYHEASIQAVNNLLLICLLHPSLVGLLSDVVLDSQQRSRQR